MEFKVNRANNVYIDYFDYNFKRFGFFYIFVWRDADGKMYFFSDDDNATLYFVGKIAAYQSRNARLNCTQQIRIY